MLIKSIAAACVAALATTALAQSSGRYIGLTLAQSLEITIKRTGAEDIQYVLDETPAYQADPDLKKTFQMCHILHDGVAEAMGHLCEGAPAPYLKIAPDGRGFSEGFHGLVTSHPMVDGTMPIDLQFTVVNGKERWTAGCSPTLRVGGTEILCTGSADLHRQYSVTVRAVAQSASLTR